MSLSRKIALNTILQAGTKIASTLLAVFSFGMITRYLGQEGFGYFTAVTAFLQFFGILSDMGLSVICLQMMSEQGADESDIYRNALGIRILVALVFLSMAPLLVLIYPSSPEVKIGVGLMAFSFFLSSLTQMVTIPFQKTLRMHIPSLSDIFSRLVLIAGIWAVIALQGGLNGIIAAVTISNLFQIIGILAFIPRNFLKPSFDTTAMKAILQRSWPIALSIVLNLIYLKTDTLILLVTRPASDVGIYGSAYRVFEVLITFPMMFLGLLLPYLTSTWSHSDLPRFKSYIQRAFDTLIIAALPLVAGAYFTGTRLMVLLSGPDFAAAGPVLPILVGAVAIIFISSLFGHLINIIHKQRVMIWGYAAGAMIGFGGYLLFIPLFGYWAAAWVTVAAEATVCITAGWIVLRSTHTTIHLGTAGKALISSLGMALVLFFMKEFPFIIQFFVAACVYGGLILGTGAMTPVMLKKLFLSPNEEKTA